MVPTPPERSNIWEMLQNSKINDENNIPGVCGLKEEFQILRHLVIISGTFQETKGYFMKEKPKNIRVLVALVHFLVLPRTCFY